MAISCKPVSVSKGEKSPFPRILWAAYANVVFELNSFGGVKIDLLQGLSHNIVRLALAGCGSLDGGGLVYVSLVVDIEPAKGIR